MQPTSPVGPATVRLWSLSEDALVEEHADGSLTLVTRWGEQTVPGAERLAVESLRRMALGPVSLSNVAAGPGYADVLALERVLDRFSGSVVHSLGLPDGQRPLLSASPVVARPRFRPVPVDRTRPIRLSRFASMRWLDDLLVLESPGAQFRVSLDQPPAVRVVTSLAAPTTIAKVAAVAGLAPGVVADVVAFLGGTGAVLRADGAGRFAEDDDPARRQWSHHELTFAAFSRTRQPDGRGPHPGAEEPAAPVTRPEPSGARLPLYRPDLTAVAARDPVLTELLETDHRCPEFSGVDLTADAVGELLYRTARIRSVGPSYVPMAASYEASQRPYLNIACLYELELYLTVNRCDGLPRGTYHYDPLGHALTAVQDDPAVLTTLLDLAKVAAGSTRQPALLLTITARMGRVSWILPRSAYATTLMHVGALQQTLYLGAKAMGLSAHAVVVDAGNTVDRALRLDWPGETVVGECVVDRPP